MCAEAPRLAYQLRHDMALAEHGEVGFSWARRGETPQAARDRLRAERELLKGRTTK